MSKVFYVLARKEEYKYFTGEDFTQSLTSVSFSSGKPVKRFNSIAEVLQFLAGIRSGNASYVEKIVRVTETPVPVPVATFEEEVVK